MFGELKTINCQGRKLTDIDTEFYRGYNIPPTEEEYYRLWLPLGITEMMRTTDLRYSNNLSAENILVYISFLH